MVINSSNQGFSSGAMNNTTSYSNDTLPDFIEMLAWDPGRGHYEVVGLQRFLTDRVQLCTVPTIACSATSAPANLPIGPASNHMTEGCGVGGSVLL